MSRKKLIFSDSFTISKDSEVQCYLLLEINKFVILLPLEKDATEVKFNEQEHIIEASSTKASNGKELIGFEKKLKVNVKAETKEAIYLDKDTKIDNFIRQNN